MAKITLEQAIQILDLLSQADITGEMVQQTLIERFDLIEMIMKHPEAIKAIDASLFETFLRSNAPLGGSLVVEPQATGEDVACDYNYPMGWSLKTVPEQLVLFNNFFSGLKMGAGAVASLPQGAEGWLLVPKPSKIASTYSEALGKLLTLCRDGRAIFVNSRAGKIGPEYLRLTKRTGQVLGELEHSTPGDYLLLAVQCGGQYRAMAVSKVRQGFEEQEYGLGPLEVACLLLTHPERLTDYAHLGIDCPGSEYASHGKGDFDSSLCFTWSEDGLLLDFSFTANGAPGFGSASGFLK